MMQTTTGSESAHFHSARRFAQTLHGCIAYVERGVGPAALFCHGYPLNGFQWRGAIERLWSYRRCIAPDFLGLGYSEAVAQADVSPQGQARMLATFLDTLGVDSVDLIANDSGGTVAQLFAVAYPHRVRSLLLTNCDVHDNSPPPTLLPLIEAARHGMLAARFLETALADPALARSSRSLGAFYTDPKNLSDECIEVYLRPLVASPRRIELFHDYTVAFLPNPLQPIEAALRRCVAPARVVWGTGAPDFGLPWAHWLAQRLPGALGVRVVEGANLFFPEELPQLIAEEALGLWHATGPL